MTAGSDACKTSSTKDIVKDIMWLGKYYDKAPVKEFERRLFELVRKAKTVKE